MKLYVVTTSYDYETYQTFEGVFSTKEKAEQFIKEYRITSNLTEILEVELDSMMQR